MKSRPETISIENLLSLRRNGILSVNPEYQRGAVWGPTQKKKLIDSIFRGYQIPLIYLHYIKQSVSGFNREALEVIDGQQRINALYEFHEGAYRLLHPVEDEIEARFPDFVKSQPCPWAKCGFDSLSEDLQREFLGRDLSVVYIETEDENEARDLFIRLQAGVPLNAQEKRDAWPGDFAEYILRLGGKPQIERFPGHDFFREIMRSNPKRDRGKTRQQAAQIAMLLLTRRRSGEKAFCDINSSAIDDFYYQHLNFDQNSADARRLTEILDKLNLLLRDQKRPKIQGHEAIHLVLSVDSLWDEYTRGWESDFAAAFDEFRERLAKAKATRGEDHPDEYWLCATVC